ncbi:YHYH domain-containing protein [Acinetobacter sp. CIP 101966]
MGIIMKKVILLILITCLATTAYSHGGRTDKNGCHNEKKTGTRHCH